jgi:hypothetical protein
MRIRDLSVQVVLTTLTRRSEIVELPLLKVEQVAGGDQ